MVKRSYCKDDIIDLYDDNLTSDRFHHLMTHPADTCQYCGGESEEFDWEGNYPYLELDRMVIE